MHIKQVIIEGFTTYKDATAIDAFHPGFNVIVGRNGHGKSNIFAAISFVMSDKFAQLRTGDRHKLLHEGAGRDVNLATVEIIFDNADRRFQNEGPEFSIKRTIGLKKDEYFLNNKHITKSDLTSLLESAGFSRSNPYYIVEQGKIRQVAQMKDEQRLQLLREIAGTRVYDERREESQKILRDTDSRLTAIQDVIDFIDKRLRELAQEKEELTKFQELDATRRALEYTVYDKEQHSAMRLLEEIEGNRDGFAERTAKLHEEAEVAREKRAKSEDRLKTLSREIQKLESQWGRFRDERSRCIQHHEKAVLQLKELEGRFSSDKSNRHRVEARLANVKQEIQSTKLKLEKATADYQSQQVAEDEAKQELQTCQQRSNELYSKQGRASRYKSKKERDAALAKEIKAIEKSIREEKEQLSALRTKVQEFQDDDGKQSALIAELGERIVAKEAELSTVISSHGSLKEQRDTLQNSRKELQRRESELTPGFSALETAVQRAESHLASMMDKLQFKGLQSIKRLMEEARLPGVHGPLLELFSCDKRFMQCVETTAGASLFHIVCDDDSVAAKAIELLKKDNLGRVTFIPLANISASEPTYPKSSDAFPMIEKLVFQPKYRRAIVQVFGKTLICRNLDIATQFARQYNMSTITLSGDQVNRKGALTGGFIDDRRLKLEAQLEIQRVTLEYSEAASESKNVRQSLQSLDQQITAAVQDIQKTEAQKASLRRQLDQLTEEKRDLEKRRAATAKMAAETGKRVRVVEGTIAQLTSQVDGLKEEMAGDLQQSLTADEDQELHRVTARITELQQSLIKLAGARSQAEAEMKQLEVLLTDNLEKQLHELETTVSSPATDEASDQIERERHEVRVLADKLEQADNELKAAERSLDEKKDAARQIESSLDKLRSAEAAAERKLAEENKSAEKLLSKRLLLTQKRDECSKKIRDIGAVPSGLEKYKNKSVEQLMSLLAKVNTDLKAFSHVNKKAIDQFTGFTDQRAELIERKKDLDKSRQSIHELIDHLDAKKDEAIDRTFKTIAKNFTAVFSQVVPDGKGTLVLHTSKNKKGKSGKAARRDESDGESDSDADAEDSETKAVDPEATLHYAGIGIKVSFNGTDRYQSMKELSGGQQTVVALTLIFAIQRCDPSPFYVFDEIDQALDPTYRNAVAQLIKQQSSSTQFITTTFRPEQLAYADKFYFVEFRNKASRVSVIPREEAVAFVRKVEQEEQERARSRPSGKAIGVLSASQGTLSVPSDIAE